MSRPQHLDNPLVIVIRREGSAAALEGRSRPCPLTAAVTARIDDIKAQRGAEAALHVVEVQAHRLRAEVFARVPMRRSNLAAAQAIFTVPSLKPSRETSGGGE